MKYTVSFFKNKLKSINDGLEKENYIQRLRAQYVMENGQLQKVAFYFQLVHSFSVLTPEQILTQGLPVKQAEHWLDRFEPKANGFEQTKEDKFINGFDSWHWVHFEIVKNIDFNIQGSQAYFRFLVEGREGVYSLAREMTDRFEIENKRKSFGSDLPRLIQRFCIKHNI